MFTWPDLKNGSRGPEVGNLQRFLNEQGFADPLLIDDESFGPKTRSSVLAWQHERALPASGVFGSHERRGAALDGFIPFLQAKHFTPANRNASSIAIITIHDMEYPETPAAAEWCAMFFAGVGGMTAPKASCHYAVDSDSIVQSARDRDVAWHAPGVNHNGIGIEHAGRAAQSRAEWLDAYSTLELQRSAKLAAALCHRYTIPIRKLTPDQVRVGDRGFCGHHDATIAFKTRGGHIDPGPGFPWEIYLDLVREARTSS